MQCPLCNRTYSSGKFCTSCEGPDGGAVRLVPSQRQVDPEDLDQYIKMLDVFLSDGFFGDDEKDTLRELRQQYGISEQQHQSILKENRYNFRDTMPIRMVLNRKTIQGYGAGQPCLAKVRLVNTEKMPLRKIEIRYWLNSDEVYTSTIRQLMPKKVKELDLDFFPKFAGQYSLQIEVLVDPFVGATTEYVVDPLSFQVYAQSQLQSVHIHQSAENIVGNQKIQGTELPKAMLLGDGQWTELDLSPKQRSIEWGEWTAERLYQKLKPQVQDFLSTHKNSQKLTAYLTLERNEDEEFIVWEERLKNIQATLPTLIQDAEISLNKEQEVETLHAQGVQYEKDNDFTAAVRCYQQAADMGHPPSQTLLGGCYDDGRGVEQDYDLAVQWYRKAAELGNAVAMRSLGHCYYSGDGVDEDEEKAVEWYRKAAELGDADAMYSLGDCYYEGDGVEEDEEKAIEWYTKARTVALQAAGNGNPESMYILGEIYCYGNGVDEDEEKAVEWYRKAAELGDGDAMFELGDCYYNGYGVEEDYEKAVEWYRKAAVRFNTSAMKGLGDCYYNGYGVDEDYGLAVQWYRKAAELGDGDAMFELGNCYYNGYGVDKDEEKAVEWYLQADENGTTSATFLIGKIYYDGLGVPMNKEKGFFFLLKAAEKNNHEAQQFIKKRKL